MTAKRFKIVGIEEELYPMPIYYDRNKELSYDEVCDLLNELHEENQILRHELLCKQLDKAPTEPINCKCNYEVKEMTEKRFTLNSVMDFDYGILDEGKSIGSLKNICELLNELHKENQQLRKIELVGEPLELFKQNKLVKRNNEKLREENKTLKRRLMIAQDKIKGLMK